VKVEDQNGQSQIVGKKTWKQKTYGNGYLRIGARSYNFPSKLRIRSIWTIVSINESAAAFE